MSAFLYGVALQWKLDIREKMGLLTYYVVPLVFFIFMGGIFSSIDPEAKNTLIQSMTVFGVTMGAILGAPLPLVTLYKNDILKAYKVGKIPLWAGAVNNFLSALLHLTLMSLVIFFVAPIVFDAVVPQNLPLYFLTLIFFIATCLSVGTVLGLLVKDSAKLTMISQLIFLPSLMLSGIMFPVEMLPKVLTPVSRIFPATWGFELMCKSEFDLMLMLPLIGVAALAVIICVIKVAKLSK